MNSQDFLQIINEAYAPFLSELGLVLETPLVSGRYYRANIVGPKHAVSVSFEPGDRAFIVLVFSRENGRLSDIDDRLKTPRLSDLNSRFMNCVSNEERTANEAMFKYIVVRDEEEKLMLKFAKELRLVLPKYLKESVL
jgi:hypothetical protein